MPRSNEPAELLNRTEPPALYWNDRVSFPHYHVWYVPLNEVPAYGMASDQGVERVILNFDAYGVDAHPMVHRAMMELLLRSSTKRSDREVDYAVDLWGSALRGVHTRDRNVVSLQSTNRFAAESMNLLEELILSPSFESRIIDNWRSRQITHFQIARQRPSTVATHALRRALYPNHPYGYVPEETDFHLVQRPALMACWQYAITSSRCTLFYAGTDDKAMRSRLANALSEGEWGIVNRNDQPDKPWHYAQGGGALRNESVQQEQSALAMGRLLPKMPHLEMAPLSIAVMLLGGYFGSRLMSNLREEHGYTYGVHASLSLHDMANTVSIHSEVSNEFLSATVKEVYKELEAMQTVAPSPEKLQEVKAYMLGELLRRHDGPQQAVVSMMPDMLFADRGIYFQQHWLSRLLSTTGEEVLSAAQQWLAPESFTLSVAGPASAIRDVEWPPRVV